MDPAPYSCGVAAGHEHGRCLLSFAQEGRNTGRVTTASVCLQHTFVCNSISIQTAVNLNCVVEPSRCKCSRGTDPELLQIFLPPSSMPDAWDKFGKAVEVSGEGMVLTKTNGGNYSRHAAAKELLSSGVHTWEVELTSGATQNNNRDMFVGVAAPGCDAEKGDHHDKGKAWYLRTHDGNIYGGDIDTEDVAKKGKFFVVGDRVGLRLDCNDGSLRFYKNGEPFGEPWSVLGILFFCCGLKFGVPLIREGSPLAGCIFRT